MYALRIYNTIEVRDKHTQKGGDNMYPGLLGQKAIHRLSNNDMAKIVGLSRTAYEQKLRSGRFTPEECKKFIRYFDKSFEYLFATDDEIKNVS